MKKEEKETENASVMTMCWQKVKKNVQQEDANTEK